MVGAQVVYVDALSDIRIRDELDAFICEEVHSAGHFVLVQLHVRDAVHEESSDAVLPFIDSHLVSVL